MGLERRNGVRAGEPRGEGAEADNAPHEDPRQHQNRKTTRLELRATGWERGRSSAELCFLLRRKRRWGSFVKHRLARHVQAPKRNAPTAPKVKRTHGPTQEKVPFPKSSFGGSQV
eukprot:scaffold34618_cov101-Isochrysis_galbana.AAC.3